MMKWPWNRPEPAPEPDRIVAPDNAYDRAPATQNRAESAGGGRMPQGPGVVPPWQGWRTTDEED